VLLGFLSLAKLLICYSALARQKQMTRSFVAIITTTALIDGGSSFCSAFSNIQLPTISPGSLLSEVPSPALIVEMSELEAALEEASPSLDSAVNIDSWLNSLFPLNTYIPASKHPDDDDARSLQAQRVLRSGTLFLHCSVRSTFVRDKMDSRFGSGKARTVSTVDGLELASYCSNDLDDECKRSSSRNGNGIEIPLYLTLGLANHHVGGYYWGRSLGRGAAAPAQGVGVRFRWTPKDLGLSSVAQSLELFWALRRRVVKTGGQVEDGNSSLGNDGNDSSVVLTTEPTAVTTSSASVAALPLEMMCNSNDGKRSEWVDFIRTGDTLQLAPRDGACALRLLTAPLSQTTRSRSSTSLNSDGTKEEVDETSSSPGLRHTLLVGVRRAGRPRGAEPVVERVWRVAESSAETAQAVGDPAATKSDGMAVLPLNQDPPCLRWEPATR